MASGKGGLSDANFVSASEGALCPVQKSDTRRLPRERSRLSSLIDSIFLLRPVLLGPVWTIYGAGAVLAGGTPGIDLLFVSLIVGGVYVHNQLADVHSDALNEKLHLIADQHVSRKLAWGIAVGSWALGMAWAATQGCRFLLFAAAVLFGFLYNQMGNRGWKSHPVRGLLLNLVSHGSITFLAGYTAAGGEWLHGLALSISYAAAVGAVYVATTIVDSNGDRASGKRTMCVVFGAQKCARLILALVLAGALLAVAGRDWWFVAAASVSLVPAVMLLRKPERKNAQRMATWAVGVLSLVVAVRWAFLFILAAITYATSRLYYHFRFGLRYPRLGAG